MDTSLTRVPRLSRKMIAVLLLLAAVLLPGVRLHGQASPATAPAPTKAPIAPAPADPSNPSNLPVPNGARLTGTVVHEDKSPAAGAQVFLLRRGRYIGTPDPLQVLTEPDGSFTIDGLARADYRLWAQAGNFVSRQKRYGSEIVKVTQAGGDVGPINLTLHPGREVDAIVTSATDGKPIPGARLHLTWTDTIPDFTTDSAGKCTIEALTAESWQIEATAAGRAKVVKKVNLESDPRSSVDFSLPEGGSISGKVVDANGKPIAKVGLGFYPSNQGMPIADTNTSTDGTYRLDNVPLDRPGHVDTFTKVYLEKTSAIKLSQADRDQQLNFTLEPKAFRSLDGTVIDPDHKPLAHATVTYYGSSSDNVHSVKTDPAGHFHLDGIEPAGTWAPQITVRSRGWAPQVVSLDSSSPSTLTVQMTEKGHRLAGRVMDTDHKPIAGAEVYAGFNGWPNLRGGSKTTDEQGRFAFDSLPADLGFEVQADGYSDLDDQRLTIDGPDVEIVLQKEGALIGRITDQNTGAPITRFNIKLRDSALAKYDTPYPMLEISRTLTGEDFNSPTGAFRFSSMKAGAPLTLAITADGYPMQFIDDVYPTPPGRSKPLEIRLAKNPPNLIHIAGKIVSADGKPLAGVEVRAITYVVVADSAFRPTYMFDFSMLKSGQLAIQNPVHAVEAAVTAADGTFWFPDLTGDHVDLAYWSEGVPQTRLDITALSAAERANLALKVQSPATVTGHLNRTVFPAISHLTLNSTSDPTWQLEVPVQPGADHFNIPNVPPGSYKLFLAGAAIPDSSPYRPTDRQTFWFPFLSMTRFTAADGQTCSVDFGTAGYTLHGHASSAGKPLANQKIGLIMADEPQNVFRVTTTDTQGLFNFEQVSPGKYDLVALDAAESFPDLYALRKSAHTLVVEVKDKNVQADLGK